MTRVTPMRLITVGIVLLAALVSLLFVFVVGGVPGGGNSVSAAPGIKLASAAQANVLAQTLALDTSTIGIIAHLDLDIGGANPLGLTPGTGDGSFFKTVRDHFVGTGGIGAGIDQLGGNFLIANWCIPNRAGCTNIKVYLDSAGNIAAYLTRGEASALVWQAEVLDYSNPTLSNANFDTVLVGGATTTSRGGIKEALTAVGESLGTLVGGVSLHDQITWFHFGLQGGVLEADRLLMIGKAHGISNTTKVVNFALPEDIRQRVLEVSYSFYATAGQCCGTPYVDLDNVRLRSGNRMDSNSYFGGFISSVTTFNERTAHNMQVHKPTSSSGSVGAALMIIYDAP